MTHLGTIWVCQDCMLHEANGECGGCHGDDGHDKEPLGAIKYPEHLTLGLTWSEHHEECENRLASEWRGECNCERDAYSTSRCEGCGSYLHGERHGMTLWKN